MTSRDSLIFRDEKINSTEIESVFQRKSKRNLKNSEGEMRKKYQNL